MIFSFYYYFSDPSKYLKGYLKQNDFIKDQVFEAFKYYLGIMNSPPKESHEYSFQKFTDQVKKSMLKTGK